MTTAAMTDDVLEEAVSIVEATAARGIPVRLIGGLAVRVLCPDFPVRSRAGQDLDLASVSSTRKALSEFLVARGYVPDKTFNALYGHKQLYFTNEANGRALDVVVDRLEMCHVLEFRDRIERMPLTLDPLDLLLSKLQIVELNEKDAQDAIYLVSAFPVADAGESGAIDLAAFRRIVGEDWGWWRTVTMNLDRIGRLVRADGTRLVPAGARYDAAGQIDALSRAAAEAPKSLRWRVRARVGDRVRWYQLPEETTH